MPRRCLLSLGVAVSRLRRAACSARSTSRLRSPPGAYSMLGYGDVVLPGLLLVRQGSAGQGGGCLALLLHAALL